MPLRRWQAVPEAGPDQAEGAFASGGGMRAIISDMRWRCLLFLFLAPAVQCLGAADWIKVSSPNFTLYTTRAENDARQTLDTFEQTRDFFRQLKAFHVTAQPPIILVAFGSESEYRPYTTGPFVRAYFTGDDEGDYIVMSDVGREARRVAVHEYVHAVVQHSGLRLPTWLNEGLAEVYSAMESREGKLLLGEIPRDRADALRSLPWMKLRDLVRIGPQSPEFNEQDRVGMFYAESCVLAHMLMLGKGYAAKFPDFLDNISASGSEQKAFAEVYGKSLTAVERDLRDYFQLDAMGRAAYSAETHRAATGPATAATAVEVGLTLAEILAATGRPAEGMARLHLLAITHKDDADLAAAAAFLEWRIGEVDTALEHFQSALSRSEAGWRAWWDYARVLDSSGGDRAAEVNALRKVVGAKPDMLAARIQLASLLLATGEPAEALALLKQAKEVAPQYAGAVYLTMAYAALATGLTAQAKEYAEAAGTCTLRPDEKTRLQSLLSSIDRGAPAATGTALRNAADDDPGRPTLRRQPKKPEPPE